MAHCSNGNKVVSHRKINVARACKTPRPRVKAVVVGVAALLIDLLHRTNDHILVVERHTATRTHIA